MADKTLIDFYADWCGPCKQQDEIIDELSEEHDFNLIKVDVDEYQDVANTFRVKSLPTIIIINDELEDINELDPDTEFERFVGVTQKKELADEL